VSREERTRPYETIVVLRPELQEAGVKEQIERMRKLLESHGASVAAIHEWGLRELAYPIAKQRRGYYVQVEYAGTAPAVAELERSLKISDAALRFVSVRRDEEEPTAEPPPRYEAAQEDVSGPVDADDEEEGSVGDAEAGELE